MSDKPVVLGWRKSSSSMVSECIEVASTENRILIRDSADRSGAVLEFPDQDWRAFTGRITAPSRTRFCGMRKAVDQLVQ